jgi:hypothetical protein
MNAQICYPWYRAAIELSAHSAWWLADADHDGPTNSTWKLFDLTVAAAAQSWVDAALNLTATGVINGIFADGCIAKEHGPKLTPARIAHLSAAKRAMLVGL